MVDGAVILLYEFIIFYIISSCNCILLLFKQRDIVKLGILRLNEQFSASDPDFDRNFDGAKLLNFDSDIFNYYRNIFRFEPSRYILPIFHGICKTYS